MGCHHRVDRHRRVLVQVMTSEVEGEEREERQEQVEEEVFRGKVV